MDVPSLLTGGSSTVALVVNTGSRRGRDALDQCRRLLHEGGVRRVETYSVTSGDQLAGALDRAFAADPALLLVGGGDGTVSAAAGRAAGRDTVVGVLPLGTANDFARTLEMPDDLPSAVRSILEGKVVDVDLGRAGGRVFLNVASMGLSVEVTQRLSPGMKRLLGPAAYPVATVLAYRHHRPFTAHLEFPEADHEPIRLDDLLQVAVGNGRHYGGGNTVAPNASVDDTLLDVYAIEKGRLHEHVSIARLLRSGTFVKHDRVHHVTTRAVRVRTDAPMPVNLDGEITDPAPTLYEVDPDALHVAIPADSRAGTLDGSGPSTD
ncbi:lipid kinase [Nocardioides insulae]|uniref:lipid kinase n=1 Tax=Nocardioides insulae TaxID=394734 RepID=UPI000405A975|nr:lipid kinase [Nocardioides insulae]